MTWKEGVYVLEGDDQLGPVFQELHQRLRDVYLLNDWS